MVRIRVTVKKVKKCVKCGILFDGDTCSCGSSEYTEVHAMARGD